MTIKVTYNVTDVYMSQSVSPVYITVSYSDGGVSGGGVWGSITGTLSNQTDLQSALDLKVPYSGATGNVNIGEYELKAGQVTLDTSPTGTAAVGTIRWNDTTGTSETTLKGGNVIIKNGVDLVARVVNKVTPNTTLTKAAYQAVRVSGAQGQRLAIELAQANNDAGSADTIGLVTETIAPNQEGFIMTVGQLEGINTTGSLQGETWVDGDVLYLSPTTAGAITNVKPTGATGHLVIIGYVEYAHANNGKLYIKVMNGFELAELHDTSIVTPTNNQGLFYNSSNSLWENKSIATVLGYTPEQPLTFNSPLSRAGNVVSIPQATGAVNGFLSATDWTTFNSKQAALGYTPANAATTLTINGVTFDLSTSRTWTIAAGISGSGASGQVTYWTGASAVSGSNNLFWDNANGRLGIGTNTPAFKLDIQTNINSGTEALYNIKNASTGTSAVAGYQVQNNISNGSLFITSSNYTAFGVLTPNTLGFFSANATNIAVAVTGTGFFSIGTGGTPTEKLRVFNNGNVLIQNAGTYSDLGVRFGVVGDTLLRGSGNTSATTALTVQNSASATMMSISNDAANTTLNVTGSNYGAIQVSQTTANRTLSLYTTGTAAEFYTGSAITNYNFLNNGGFPLVRINTAPLPTAGGNIIEVPGVAAAFSPTSGTASLTTLLSRPTINQTGGANGITRGLYVNPTLTAAADWRSIEWSNNSGWGLYGIGTSNNYLGGNVAIGSTSNTTDWLNIAASTTAKAHIYLAAGVAPTSPANGDIWFDGTDIKMRIGGVTKTFTLV